MKKYVTVFGIFTAVLLFSSSSVWEGAAAISSEFPSDGLYAATNSFPRNTFVDITNLETGKTARIIVSAGLDTPGLLVMVSREAAEAIGLQSRGIGRVRMVQPPDPLAFSLFNEDRARSGDPDYDPDAAVGEAGWIPGFSDESAGTLTAAQDPESAWMDAELPPAPQTAAAVSPTESSAVHSAAAADSAAGAGSSKNPVLAGASPEPPAYTLVPAEERPPAVSYKPPPIQAPPIQAPSTQMPAAALPQTFNVPSVNRLESGKYYLQIGAYSKSDVVRQELSKIEKQYPLAVQHLASGGKSSYRILIGPVNQGESGALLHTFRNRGYNDAFIRKGD